MSVHVEPEWVFTMGRNMQSEERCIAWTAEVMEQLRELSPDVVILARARKRSDYRKGNSDEWAPGLVESLEAALLDLSAISRQIVVIRDTPMLKIDLLKCLATEPECVAKSKDFDDRSEALVAAAKGTEFVKILDLRDMVCPGMECPALIGNIIVWRDFHHLTATYSRSITPVFLKRISPLISAH